MINHNINHIKIPVRAAWIGSMYEVMVKLNKRLVYKIVGRQKLSYFEMLTILSKIENCINNRPLTYIHSDMHDHDSQILTPNSFLKVYGNNEFLIKPGSNQLSNDPDYNITADQEYRLSFR